MMTTTSVRRGHRIARVVVVLALTAGLSATVGSPSPAYAADDGGFAQKMLQLVNQHRAAANLGPLQWSDSLGLAAGDGRYDGCGFPVSGRATDMGTRNYFSHTILGCGTQGITGILSSLGVQTSSSGENIAWMSGTTDPLVAAERLTNDLMASPGHKANMLNSKFTHVGIGSWRTATGASWSGGGTALRNVFITAQVFGQMASTPTPPPPTVPAAPTAVSATGGDGSVKVSWAPAGSGSAVDSYAVFVWDSSGFAGQQAVVCATCLSATLTGLTNGRTYYVTVYGHNGAGWGPAALSGWFTVAAVPGAPTELTVTPGNGSISATWRGPTNPGTAIDGYGVFIFDANGYTEKYAWVCSTCTSATVPGLVNGRSYLAVVYAHNPNGWGTPTFSGWLVAGTPAPPKNLTITKGNGSIGASWSPAANSGTPIDVYGLFAYDADGYTGLNGTACGTCTTGTVAGLTSGKMYTIVIYAYNAFGWSTPVSSAPVVPA